MSQSQNLIPPSGIVTYESSLTEPIRSPIVSETKNTPKKTSPALVEVHHIGLKNYILEPYCRPVLDSGSSKQPTCKYGRACIVNKSKIFVHGDHLPHLSSTVFQSNRVTSKKFNYDKMDTRLVTCFNKLCKNANTKLPKSFHYICFQHMMKTLSNNEMSFLEIETPKDKIFEQIMNKVDMKKVMAVLQQTDTKLIFPVCGKRCFNSVSHLRNKKDTKGDSEYAQAKSWEGDGSIDRTIRSSIDIMINWLTTEENASKYFGGLDKNGKTNATRKEAYHYHLRDLIKKENGKYYMSMI